MYFYFFHKKQPLRMYCILCMILLCGCDFTIEKGDFKELKIGMSKGDVIIELSRQNVAYIEPRVNKYIEITVSSINKLDQLKNTEGICMTDNGRFGLHIVFDKQGMSHSIFKSSNVDLSALGLQLPLSRKDTLERIKDILQARNNIIVFNCILDVEDMSLNNVDINDLERIDSWLYHIPNSHSAATLHFSNGKLVKVIYHWQPIELP